MREKKWTLGPWNILIHMSRTISTLTGPLGEKIASILYGDRAAGQANARLIASAPDLVEALEEMKTQIQQVADGDRPYTGFDTELMDAALAKAYGEIP